MSKQAIARKFFTVKEATASGNRIIGAPSVMGVMDRGGDVIAPGSFKKAIKQFLTDGFVPVGHNWSDFDKIACTPEEMREDGLMLYSEAEWHTTEYAQSVKTIVEERIARGKSVGLSIGFSIASGGYARFDDGPGMLKFCKDNGIDTTGWDEKGIRAHNRTCWLITEIGELYEYSIVTVPMNPHATVSAVKQLSLDEDSPAGSRFEQTLDSVLAAVEGANERFASYRGLREKEGRPVSPDRLAQVEAIHEGLGKLIELAKQPVPNDADAARIRIAKARAGALLMGA